MKSNRHRWTIIVVTVWVLALVFSSALVPTPAEAEVWGMGWMVYTPNHPNGCAPLPFDCYVVCVSPND